MSEFEYTLLLARSGSSAPGFAELLQLAFPAADAGSRRTALMGDLHRMQSCPPADAPAAAYAVVAGVLRKRSRPDPRLLDRARLLKLQGRALRGRHLARAPWLANEVGAKECPYVLSPHVAVGRFRYNWAHDLPNRLAEPLAFSNGVWLMAVATESTLTTVELSERLGWLLSRLREKKRSGRDRTCPDFAAADLQAAVSLRLVVARSELRS